MEYQQGKLQALQQCASHTSAVSGPVFFLLLAPLSSVQKYMH